MSSSHAVPRYHIQRESSDDSKRYLASRVVTVSLSNENPWTRIPVDLTNAYSALWVLTQAYASILLQGRKSGKKYVADIGHGP